MRFCSANYTHSGTGYTFHFRCCSRRCRHRHHSPRHCTLFQPGRRSDPRGQLYMYTVIVFSSAYSNFNNYLRTSARNYWSLLILRTPGAPSPRPVRISIRYLYARLDTCQKHGKREKSSLSSPSPRQRVFYILHKDGFRAHIILPINNGYCSVSYSFSFAPLTQPDTAAVVAVAACAAPKGISV